MSFKPLKYTWVDKGDLHSGNSTKAQNGLWVTDDYFKRLVKYLPTAGDYDIRISWNGESEWELDGERARVVGGWPPPQPMGQ